MQEHRFMTSQSPSTLVPSDIDLGNCILYYAPSPFTSFAAALAATTWRKFGLMKEGVKVDVSKVIQEFYSGYPSKLQQQYVSGEDFRVMGECLEVNPRQMARVLGGPSITETVKTTAPGATTVATGSTKTVVQVASATGYAVGDEIRVGDAGSYQYGRIKSISGNALTLYEALSGDTNPTTGHAVAKIDTSYFDLGGLTLPESMGIKISHTLPGGYGSYDWYVLKAQMTGNLSINWQDNNQNPDANGMPFELRALSDPDVESGNTVRVHWTQS
jgi:hypothetical protein